MGLVGLVGGGIPAFASTAASTGDGTSTNPPHAIGQQAVDSSGGVYILARFASTTVVVGSLAHINSSIGYGHAVIVPVSTTSTGTVVGRVCSTANSTAQYGWFQTYGPTTLIAGTTASTAGQALWTSTATAGYVVGASGGVPIVGAQVVSSNNSSLWNCFLSYPVINPVVL